MSPEPTKSLKSASITSLLKYATEGKSHALTTLRESMWPRIYEICDAVEENDTMRQMVMDYVRTRKISRSRLTKLRNFLRQQSGINKNEDIEALSEQIKTILSEDTSFLTNSVEVLASITDRFADAFIKMHDYTADDPEVLNGGGIAVKARRFRRGGEESEPWQEDEEVSDLDKRYVHIIRSLCSHIDSYVRYLDGRGNRAPSGDGNQTKICEEESLSGRWKAFRKLVLSLKKIRLDATMMQVIEDAHYDTSNDLQGTIESMDGYSMMFDVYMSKKESETKE